MVCRAVSCCLLLQTKTLFLQSQSSLIRRTRFVSLKNVYTKAYTSSSNPILSQLDMCLFGLQTALFRAFQFSGNASKGTSHNLRVQDPGWLAAFLRHSVPDCLVLDRFYSAEEMRASTSQVFKGFKRWTGSCGHFKFTVSSLIPTHGLSGGGEVSMLDHSQPKKCRKAGPEHLSLPNSKSICLSV